MYLLMVVRSLGFLSKCTRRELFFGPGSGAARDTTECIYIDCAKKCEICHKRALGVCGVSVGEVVVAPGPLGRTGCVGQRSRPRCTRACRNW